ncbi:MAG TPA: branched-chain amino acid ABC transporter permease [Phototrophicaceae bacterium]|nr:branched-chain amino acid ABC transporter permease [Phototrophicaceae bacterium]
MLEKLQTYWSRLSLPAQIALVLISIAAVPFITDFLEGITGFGLLTQVNRALIYVVLALGLNVVVGFAGLLDLGYAAFFAIGAYAFGVLTWPTLHLNTSFFIAIWICAAIAALFGVFVGAPTLRLRGDYLAIVTLAFGEIIPTLVRNLDNVTIRIGNWTLIEKFNLTNGPLGMNPLGRPDFSLLERALNLESGRLAVAVNPNFWYVVIVMLVALVLFASRRLEDSRIGRAWKAIREDETAAEFMGVNVVRAKLLAFGIGASFSGLAGAVFASMLGAIFPDLFRFQVSIFLLIIVILSGLGSIWGVLIGGLLISTFDGVFLAQIMPVLFPNSDVQSLRWVFFGIGLISFMIFRPQGLFGPRQSAPIPPPSTPPTPAAASQGGS